MIPCNYYGTRTEKMYPVDPVTGRAKVVVGEVGICLGSHEQDICFCEGDRLKCRFCLYIPPFGTWIAVGDALPEEVYGKERKKIPVIVFTGKRVSEATRCAEYTLRDGEWVPTGEFRWSGYKRVTHWMPMPNPPEEGE